MSKQTVKEQVKKRIEEMQHMRAKDMATIQQKIAEEQIQLKNAQNDAENAAAVMNIDAFNEAQSRERDAKAAIDMYSRRYEQLRRQKYISEAESDQVIESLLSYERQLENEYETSIAYPIKQLAKLQKDYEREVKEVEETINLWCNDICANHKTRGRTLFRDDNTGEMTDRSPVPVPVHGPSSYSGCKVSIIIKELLAGDLSKYTEE